MAVELKKFQAEFQKIEAATAAAFGEMKLVGDSEGNMKKLLDGARLAVGDRVQVLRTQNVQGNAVADFAADKEVKAALGTVDTALTNYKALEARKIGALGDIKKVYNDLRDLADRMDAEIKDRKKKMFEPKSLPDMVKLADKVRKTVDEEGGLKTESIKDIAARATPKVGAFEAKYRADLELEIKKSASIRANASASEALEKFKPRLIKLRSDRVKSLAQEAEKLCAAALAAQKAGNAKLAKEAVDTAVKKAEEMHAITDDYNEAYTKNKSFLAQNPDAKAMFDVVSTMTSAANRVLKAVQATQSAVK